MQYKVEVIVNRPVRLTYLVEADSEEEAKANYEGFEVIEEEELNAD